MSATTSSETTTTPQQQLRIGVIGGMSWTSTRSYYEALNRLAQQKGGGLTSADLILRSVNFAEIEKLQKSGDWEKAGEILAQCAADLLAGGADFVLLATNTMHLCAPAIERRLDDADEDSQDSQRFLHIADATAAAIKRGGFKSPGLMATRYTMENHAIVQQRLKKHGLDVIIPDEDDREACHRVIFEELCKDIVTEKSRTDFERIAERLHEAGADCLILGCTEVGLLLNEQNTPLPCFDTAEIHCEAAIERAFGGSE